MSLLVRLLLLVAIAVLPAIGIHAYDQWELRRAARTAVEAEVKRLLGELETEQARVIAGIRQVLSTISKTNALASGGRAECQNLLTRLDSSLPPFQDIHATDLEGNIICSTDFSALGTQIGDRPHYRDALSSQRFVIGEYLVRRSSGEAVLPFALPYTTLDGTRRGVVTLTLNLRWLDDFVSHRPLPENSSLTIADKSGIILLRLPERESAGHRLPESYMALLRQDRPGVLPLSGFGGPARLVAYSPPGANGNDLFISIGLDQRLALAEVARITWRGLGLLALDLVLALVAAWLLYRRWLERPIRELSETIEHWRLGDHDARVHIVGAPTELSTLGRAFDEMAAATQEREAAANAGRTAERRAARVLASTTDGVIEVDRDWRITFLNERANKLLGERRQLLGQVLWRAFPQAVATRFFEEYHRAMRDQVTVEFEEYFPPFQCWFAVRVFPTADGLAIYFQDVTQRRIMEREVLKGEARYRAIVDTAVDAMVVIDEAGTIQSFNRAAETIFGWSAVEAIGRNVRVLMPADEAVEHDQHLLRYLTTGKAGIIGKGREVIGMRRDGSTFPLDLSIAEWLDGDQRHFTGIMRDISQRKRVEQQIRVGEQRLRMALRAAQAATWDWDIRNGEHAWSDEYYEVSGIDRSKPPSYDAFLESVHPEDRGNVEKSIHDLLAECRTDFTLEFRVLHPVKGLRWLTATGQASYSPDGKPIRMAGLNIDTTERKRIEEALIETKAEAEQANVAKSKFLAAASHDLRQPVQSLVLLISALSAQLADHPALPLVGHIERALSALRTLLDGLLDISKLDAGVIVPQIEELPLGPLLQRLAEDYRLPAEQKGLTLKAVTTSAWVRSDPALLERVLRNLVENALRYTRQGSILIGCRRRGHELSVQVVDTGIGIEPQQRDLIFQEFYQIGNAERDRGQGLGLGLAIVRRLARLLGHRVTVSSMPARGSCFAVHLPMVHAITVQETALAEPESSGEPLEGLILIVDDEELIRTGLRMQLEDWGYRVLEAATGEEAVAVIDHARPDVIVADYRLREGERGTDVIRAVHAACKSMMPGIVLTGDTAPERIAEVERSGYRILHKPVSPPVLRELLRSALRSPLRKQAG